MNATGFQVIENGAVVGGGTFSNELQSLGNGSQALVQQGQTLGGAFDLGGSLLSSNELQSFGNSITGIAGGSNPEGTGTANDTGALGGLFGSGGSSGNGSLTDTVNAYFVRAVVIILGFIFVAAGLALLGRGELQTVVKQALRK